MKKKAATILAGGLLAALAATGTVTPVIANSVEGPAPASTNQSAPHSGVAEGYNIAQTGSIDNNGISNAIQGGTLMPAYPGFSGGSLTAYTVPNTSTATLTLVSGTVQDSGIQGTFSLTAANAPSPVQYSGTLNGNIEGDYLVYSGTLYATSGAVTVTGMAAQLV